LVYAANLHSIDVKNIQLYTLKVRGFEATIHRAAFPKEYLEQLTNQCAPTQEVEILEYDGNFDIRSPKDRKDLFEILLKIKHVISKLPL